MTHDLKIHPEHFAPVKCGVKTCEIRKDDRDYKVGDFLCLNEWDPKTESYSGDLVHAKVTHIDQIGFEFVALSIKLVDPLAVL